MMGGKRAFFVIGSEGSGTNMLAEALVSAGCHEDPRHRSYMKDYEFDKMPDLLMFRRSFPHRGEWFNPLLPLDRMQQAGYFVHALFILRDYFATAKSVIRRDSTRTIDDVYRNQNASLGHIQVVLNYAAEFTYVSYESFCLHSEFRRWLFVERLGLKEPTIEINYANEKYYGG